MQEAALTRRLDRLSGQRFARLERDQADHDGDPPRSSSLLAHHHPPIGPEAQAAAQG